MSKIEKCENFYFFWKVIKVEYKVVDLVVFNEVYDFIFFWYNINEMINIEFVILKKWVGNDEMDFLRMR